MGSSETMTTYPQRVGEPDCRDFLRTGRCKYGDSCKYHHPLGGIKASDPNEPPFPIRPGEPNCQYYLKNATCKFGQTCKFHHPPHVLLAKGGSNVASSRGNPNANAPNTVCEIINVDSGGGDSNGSVNNSNDRTPRDFRDILPQRPGEPDCIYFLRNGRCKYGATCKYHHPTNGKDTFSSNDRFQVPANPPMFQMERSHSEVGVEGHEPQRSFVAAAMQRHQSNPMYESVHRKLQIQGQNVLGTIDNSYQQYPQGAIDMNNLMGGNFHNFPNGSGASSKIGSPSMSSTTVASSYDTATSGLEALPPSRVQAQAQNASSLIGSPNPNQGLHAQLNLYSSEISKLPLHQVNNGQYLNRTNSKDEVGPLYCNPLQSNVNDSPRISNVRSLNDIQQQLPLHHQQQQQQQFLVGRHSMKPSLSSNTSIASLSPSSDKNDLFQQELNRSDIPKNRRTIDDGLSMMTDALLTMLDTPDEGNQGNSHNQKVFINRRAVNDPSISGLSSTSSSLPEYLLSDNSARTSQMNPSSHSYALQYGLNLGERRDSCPNPNSDQKELETMQQPRLYSNRGNIMPSANPTPSGRQGRPPPQFFVPS